jgi:hypothetical protein
VLDARRLGVGLYLPRTFLTDATADYLTDHNYDHLTDDWAEQAFADLTAPSTPCRCARLMNTANWVRAAWWAELKAPVAVTSGTCGGGARDRQWAHGGHRARRQGFLAPVSPPERPQAPPPAGSRGDLTETPNRSRLMVEDSFKASSQRSSDREGTAAL